ncbi:acetylcholinesterase-like [Copidosoma floridanum]|uniref:acetylcholinesterase-like n=1 Tax=Copidosoma floridanum TaxID=29053 RepID=UPI0006C9ADB5|nr:acetylcholinesterase-like [Copidosoma floridanum]
MRSLLGVLVVLVALLPDGALSFHVRGREARAGKNNNNNNGPSREELEALEDPLVVRTTSGLMRGSVRTIDDREVHVYLGVPFAKPPVGRLRFRKPAPMDPWPGVLNATQMPNSCIQERYEYFQGFDGEEMWNPNTNVSEDCLYMNIWVPKKVKLRHKGGGETPGEGGMPILVWIYGGGYMTGTATLDVYDADIMAAKSDAIIASMQYRVGAFGFLYLKEYFEGGATTEDAPGNMGLWDQVMALKWLKDNARLFGGDPELITIFGESAGGGSVSLHLMSPVTKGLVRRGVLQSGTLNAPWSYMTAEKASEVARILVEDCGCNSTMLEDSPGAAMACMRAVDAKTISVQQWNSYGGILGFPYAPTIDGVFLPQDPIELLREADFNKTEIIIGNNENEGTYFILYDFIEYFEKDNPTALDRSKFTQIINTIFKNMTKIERDAIAFQYTDWENPKDDYIYQRAIADIVGDYFFICPSIYFAQLFTDRGMKVYYYYFTQKSSTNLWGDWMGVMHGDEIEYVFGHPLNDSLTYKENERELALKMIKSYSNFAKYGKPTLEESEWPPYTRDDPYYYIFNAEKNGMGKGPRLTACAFWNDFLPRLKGVPDPTPEVCSGAVTSNISAGAVGLRGSCSLTVTAWMALLSPLVLLRARPVAWNI